MKTLRQTLAIAIMATLCVSSVNSAPSNWASEEDWDEVTQASQQAPVTKPGWKKRVFSTGVKIAKIATVVALAITVFENNAEIIEFVKNNSNKVYDLAKPFVGKAYTGASELLKNFCSSLFNKKSDYLALPSSPFNQTIANTNM